MTGRRRRGNDLVLRVFQIFHRDITAKVADLYASAEMRASRAGAPVRNDVSGIDKDRSNEVTILLHRHCLVKQFIPSQSASAAIVALVDTQRDVTAIYHESQTDPDHTRSNLRRLGRADRSQIP